MTTQLLSQSLYLYAKEFTSPESEVLSRLNRETNLKIEMPVMLSGHLQGAILRQLSCMIRPQNILEIGTYTGYSAICLSEGLQAEGKLHTIDINEELKDIAFRYFCAAGLDKKIIQHTGKAAQIIPTIEEEFQLVFIDADKQNYSLYYDLIFDKVLIGGFILADNVLYNGEVVLPNSEQSKNARAIQEFNEKIAADTRIEQVLLPVRDGIMIMRKLSQ